MQDSQTFAGPVSTTRVEIVPREALLQQVESLLGGRPPRHEEVAADLAGICEWMDGRIERQLWGWPRLRTQFVQRSPREIMQSRGIHYAAPCVDLSTCLAEILKACGYQPTVVLTRIKRPLQAVKFQMGLELQVDGVTYCLGFTITSWKLIIGSFVVARSRTHVLRRPLPLDDTLDRRYLSLFGIGSLSSVGLVIPGYDPLRDLAWFRRTIAPRKFRKAQRKTEKKVRVGKPGVLRASGSWQQLS